MFDVIAHNRIRRGMGCPGCHGSCTPKAGMADTDWGYWDDYMYAFSEDYGYGSGYPEYFTADYSGYDYSSDAAANAAYDAAIASYGDAPPDWLSSGYEPGRDYFDSYFYPVADDAVIDGSWVQNYDGTWTDGITGISVDSNGNWLDWGEQDFTADSDDTIRFTTTETAPDVVIQSDNSINLADLGNTLDWWQEVSSDPLAHDYGTITLPPITYDAGYILNTPSTILASNPQTVSLPANSPLKKPSTWDTIKRALAQQAQRALSGAASGGSGGGGSRPQTTAPNAQGQCPTGYAKNPQTGQCQLIQRATQTVRNPVTGQPMQVPNRNQGLTLQSFLSNPLYLLLAGLGLILLAKR